MSTTIKQLTKIGVILFLIISYSNAPAQKFESAISIRAASTDVFINDNNELQTLIYFGDSLHLISLQTTFFVSGNRAAVLKQSANGQVISLDTLPSFFNAKWHKKGNYTYLYGSTIAKYDSAMNLIWEKTSPPLNAMAVDANDNIYGCGSFQVSVDVDPDTIQNYTISATGSYDIFNFKWNSSGFFQHGLGSGHYGADFVSDLIINEHSHQLDGGTFLGQAYFPHGSSNLLSSPANNQFDAYIRKSDSLGNLIWIRQLKGIGSGSNVDVRKLTQAKNGDIYASGSFSGTVNFNTGITPTVISLTSANYKGDLFLLKMDSSGNFKWVKSFTGIQDKEIGSISEGPDGDVYLAGDFQGTIDFDPGPSIFNRVSSGGTDIFVVRLDSNGNFKTALSFGSTQNDKVKSIHVKDEQNFLICGAHAGSMLLPSFSTPIYLPAPPASSYQYGFTAKLNWNNIATNVEESRMESSIAFYPNPASQSLTVEILKPSDGALIEIFSYDGRVVKEVQLLNEKQRIDVSTLAEGVYIVKVGEERQKLVISR